MRESASERRPEGQGVRPDIRVGRMFQIVNSICKGPEKQGLSVFSWLECVLWLKMGQGWGLGGWQGEEPGLCTE